jgi:hypothetical protein
VIQTKQNKTKSPAALPNGLNTLQIDSIYESLNENLYPVLVMKFKNDVGFILLKLPIEMNNKLSLTLGNLAALGGVKPGTDLKLSMLISLQYNVTINNNKITKIQKHESRGN